MASRDRDLEIGQHLRGVRVRRSGRVSKLIRAPSIRLLRLPYLIALAGSSGTISFTPGRPRDDHLRVNDYSGHLTLIESIATVAIAEPEP